MASKLEVVGVYSTEPEAQLAEAQLRAAGIECRLQKDDAGGLVPNLDLARGIRLQVLPEDAERAREILASDATEDSPG